MTQKRQRLPLTDEAIFALPDPTARIALRDRRISQLVLLVGQRSRTWYLHGTVDNRTHRVRLGRFPILGTEQARDACLTALRRLYAGQTPLVASKTAPGRTLVQVLDEYIAMRRLGAKATADLRSIIRVHASTWADRPITQLEPSAVASYYRKLADKHPAPANRLLAAISALSRFSVASYGEGDASLVHKVKALLGGAQTVPAREVVIPDDILASWAAEVGQQVPRVARYLKALMLTGMRANELRSMPREAWEGEAGMVRVATTKNGKPHALPVGPVLRSIIEAEVRDTAQDGALFDVGEDDYRQALACIGAGIGLSFHLHDLRRTFGTAAVRVGLDAYTVKRLMNHSAGNDVTAKHYIKLSAEDLRPAMERIEAYFVAAWGR